MSEATFNIVSKVLVGKAASNTISECLMRKTAFHTVAKRLVGEATLNAISKRLVQETAFHAVPERLVGEIAVLSQYPKRQRQHHKQNSHEDLFP